MFPEPINIQEPKTIKEYQSAINLATKKGITVSFPCGRSCDDIKTNVINDKELDLKGSHFIKADPESKTMGIAPKALWDLYFL